MPVFRDATAADLAGIFAIYDAEVLHGTATFDTEPYTLEQRKRWFEQHNRPEHPLIVASEGPVIAGWGSLSRWSDRFAYARAAEVSVYVHETHRRKGLGRALLLQLLAAGREAHLGVLLSRVATESSASLALHDSLGFRRVGTMRRVGEKHGRILDVELLEFHLDET